MRFQIEKENKHSISILSNLFLFFVFTFVGICVVLVGAKVYQSVTENMEENYAGRTALAYTAEKIRQHDTADAISLSMVENVPALCLNQHIKDSDYATYIYYYDGYLREAFVKADADVTLLQGSPIVKLPGFIIEKTDNNMYQLTATEHSGDEISMFIRPKCQ